MGLSDHAPTPHGVRLAVAGPVHLVHELTTRLAHAAPGGFTIVAAPSERAIIDGVRAQPAAGGLVAGPAGTVTIVMAGAAGSSQ